MDRRHVTIGEKKRIALVAKVMVVIAILLIVRIAISSAMAEEEQPEVASKIEMAKVYPEEISLNKIAIWQVTDEERFWLEAITFAEAGTTEGLTGQIAIAAEVLNRVESPDFPDSVIEVLLQEGQYYDDFPQWNSPEGWRYVTEADITGSVREAVQLALNGSDPTELYFGTYGAFFHYAPEYTYDEGKFNIVNQIQIGNHMFYQSWEGYYDYSEE